MKSMLRAVTKKYLLLLLSLSLTASLGFALTMGLSSGYHSLEKSLDSYLTDFGYPDGVITTEVTSVSDAEKLRDIPGVEAVDTSLCADTMLRTEEEEYLAVRLFSYTDQDRQKFYYWEQADDGGEDSVLLEYHFAESHGISAGDTVSFRIRGEYRPVFVAGIINRPETLYAKYSDQAWGINYDFGFAYMKRDLLAAEYEKDVEKEQDKLDEKAKDLKEGRDKADQLLDEKEKELKEAKKLLAEKESLFGDKKKEAEKAKAKLKRTRGELKDLAGEIQEKKAPLQRAIKQAQRAQRELKKQQDSLKKQKRSLKKQKESLEEAKKSLEKIDLLTEQADELQKILEEPETLAMIAYLRQLPPDTLLKDVIDPETLQELIDKIAEFDLPGEHPDIEKMTVGDVLELYDQADVLIPKALEMLQEQRSKILKKLEEAGITEDQIDEALGDLNKGIREINKGLAELRRQKNKADRAEEKASAALRKADETEGNVLAGIRKIDNTLEQIDQRLKKAGDQLAGAGEKIRKGEQTLKQETADSLKEFADMEKKLDRAYAKLDEGEGYDQLCNRFLLYFDEDADSGDVLSRACRTLGDDTEVISSYTYEDSPVKQRIDINLDPIHVLTVYCPAIFYLVALGISFMFMSMIIRQSRRQIGILRALGMTKGWIRRLYCAVSVLVALAGILIGSGIGAGILCYIGGYYRDFFPLPAFQFGIDWPLFLAGTALTIAVCLAATLITTGSISSITPREAMNRQISVHAALPAWAARLTRWMRPISKFGLTSLLRNKGRFVCSSIFIAVSVMLIFTSVSFIASSHYTIKQVFKERIHYDCQIFLEDAPKEELIDRLNDLDYVSNAQPLLYYEADISAGGRTESAVINAVAPGTDLVTIPKDEDAWKKPRDAAGYDAAEQREMARNGAAERGKETGSDAAEQGKETKSDAAENGEGLHVRRGGIVLEKHLAADLGVGPGDIVTLNGESYTVSDISQQCVNRVQYVSLDDADRLGTPQLGCIICSIPEKDQQKLLTWLMDEDIDGYLYTMFMAPFFRYNVELYKTHDTAAWILIWFAVILGFVILFNTTMTNLMDTRREICVLRSQGFQYGEISRSRLSQTVLQYLVSCPVGLVAGLFFAKWMLLKIGSEDEEYLFASGFPEVAASVGIVLAYLLLCHLMAMRSTKKWDVPGIVKDQE